MREAFWGRLEEGGRREEEGGGRRKEEGGGRKREEAGGGGRRGSEANVKPSPCL
jgi:hypothetical protein